MTLKAVLENLDEIDESLKSEYKEKDGKFYLDLDDSIKVHSSILPLSNSLKNVKVERDGLKARVAAAEAKSVGLPDDFTVERYNDIVAELEALKKDPNRDKDAESKLTHIREQYEQRLRAAEEKRVADLAAKDAIIEEGVGAIEKLVVGDGLTQALVSAGVGKEFLKASQAMLKPVVKVVKDEDTGERKAVVETDLGAVPVSQFVDNWSKSDEGKVFVTKPSGSGSGGNGNDSKSEVNPWLAATRNITDQGKILQTDRVKAERMMKAAGIPVHTINQTLGR